ncbi:hypothetical protein IFR05_016693, partial [Cadophora sp. M221]
MLRQRQPLGLISGNRVVKKQLTPYQRGLIVGESRGGAKSRGIAKALNVVRSTISYTLLQEDLRPEGTNLPKTPRKNTYTKSDERNLLRHVKKYPKDSYKEVIEACGL